MFLWHFPWDRSHWPLASILLYGVRTFLGVPRGNPRLPVLLKPACLQRNIPAQGHQQTLALVAPPKLFSGGPPAR